MNEIRKSIMNEIDRLNRKQETTWDMQLSEIDKGTELLKNDKWDEYKESNEKERKMQQEIETIQSNKSILYKMLEMINKMEKSV